MLGALKYPDDLSKSPGLNQHRGKDTYELVDSNVGFDVKRQTLLEMHLGMKI